MRIGFGAPVSGAWATPRNVGHFAERAEDLGYASLWTFHRLLTPAEKDALAPVYRSVLDPLLTLTYAAARTSRIRLGVSLVNFPFVTPVYLAKEAATLDVLSNGRFDLGLGAGWQHEEFVASGTSEERRGARAEEFVAALRTLWEDEVSEYDGEFYTIPPSRQAPKPVQKPHPPVLLGGVAEAALKRAGRIAEGWLSRSATDLSRIHEQIAIVRQAAEDAGKDPEAVRVVVRGVVRAGEEATYDAGKRLRLSGSYDQIREDTAWLAEQGVTELFYDLNWDPLVGSPDAEPKAATARAEEIIEALSPDA
ncbi:TIGR03619 family F420-dependent LLM class oxidoreductase [Actinoallomurus rhizosphaericola]|uniref:TIGR03619 family F420-dependent LLM class oxidoreductase n=1 Tax=Actinoallomurus rhizosphaericola TaxID=2952536 RepID=UPI002090BFC8|nr:TIGR03619 family F420-dependent LLM class oxidoreductase [Actinoallomurus rhizosphaericola]MCO5994491.1 TIGR03619 family F420-dependent LLM class oxidoreductase [Actinoallomurus rhizosphaericola]